jgi:hypothetical protein
MVLACAQPVHRLSRAHDPAWGELMIQRGFDFVATGEVLNQRPMSQNRRLWRLWSRMPRWAGELLRPLSALLLEPTVPELEGVVDRSRLLGLSAGRANRSANC